MQPHGTQWQSGVIENASRLANLGKPSRIHAPSNRKSVPADQSECLQKELFGASDASVVTCQGCARLNLSDRWFHSTCHRQMLQKQVMLVNIIDYRQYLAANFLCRQPDQAGQPKHQKENRRKPNNQSFEKTGEVAPQTGCPSQTRHPVRETYPDTGFVLSYPGVHFSFELSIHPPCARPKFLS